VDAQGRITAASTNAVSIPPAVGGSNGVDFNDNVKARFGTGNDLEIYHDATDSRLVNNTGFLKVMSDSMVLEAANGDNFITAVNSGAVILYHQGGNQKLATTSTGVSVTGTVAATSYTGDGSSLTGVASTVADGCIYENSQTISNNYTITTNKNAMSAGPITVASGATLTIPSGSTYTIV